VTLELELAPFFAALLLGRPLSLDDMPALDQQLHRSLCCVKRYAGDVQELGLEFEAECDDGAGGILRAELPGGGGPVTNANRLAYVAAVAEWRLAGSLADSVTEFRAGLTVLMQPRWLSLFSPVELGSLLSGGAADWRAADLRAHCELAGFWPASRTLAHLWAVLDGFTPAQRSRFLCFVTACARLPHGGFAHMHPRIWCVRSYVCPLTTS
jgi:hypothetical protein